MCRRRNSLHVEQRFDVMMNKEDDDDDEAKRLFKNQQKSNSMKTFSIKTWTALQLIGKLLFYLSWGELSFKTCFISAKKTELS